MSLESAPCSTRRRRRLRAVAVPIAAICSALGLASSAQGQVGTPVPYCYVTLNPRTACTNGNIAQKIYNEIFVNFNTSTGPAIGVYEVDNYGVQAFTLNGRGYVYIGHGAYYARSYCRNNSYTNAWSVKCSYTRL